MSAIVSAEFPQRRFLPHLGGTILKSLNNYFGTRPFIAFARAPWVMRPAASVGSRSRIRVLSNSTSPGAASIRQEPACRAIIGSGWRSSHEIRTASAFGGSPAAITACDHAASVRDIRRVADALCAALQIVEAPHQATVARRFVLRGELNPTSLRLTFRIGGRL
jgi:hypothetical protein